MNTQEQTLWKVDPTHAEIGFKVKHMMISTVKGHFDSFDVEVSADDNEFKNASVKVEVDIASINTKNSDRDNHLKSDDFFNAEKFPKMTFESTAFDGEKLVGNLTIRDTTKEVELDVDFNGIAVDPYGQTKAGFEVSGEINRKEFGLSWGAVTEAGSIVVAENVKLQMDLQLIKSLTK